MTTTTIKNETNLHITSLLKDKKNWETKGKYDFQKVIESILIEVEEDIEKAEKSFSFDLELDEETKNALNKFDLEDSSFIEEDLEDTDDKKINFS